MSYRIEIEREVDGRWIAEIPSLPGVLAYGKTKPVALARVKALAGRPGTAPIKPQRADF